MGDDIVKYHLLQGFAKGRQRTLISGDVGALAFGDVVLGHVVSMLRASISYVICICLYCTRSGTQQLTNFTMLA
jgi:hypothetical protein